MLWLLLGKLPIILSNLWLTWFTAKRTGWFIASMATLMMWSTLALGIFILPSIIGAFLIAIIAHTLTLRFYIPKQSTIPRHSAGALAIAFGLILVVGRVGCWLSACCYGTLFDGWWATHYEAGSRAHLHFQELNLISSAQEAISLHPVQLYESMGVLLCLGLGIYLFAKRNFSEIQASLSFAGAYLLLRALIDPLRAEVNTLSSVEYSSIMGLELSLFQWGCLAIALLLTTYIYLQRHYTKSHQDCMSQTTATIKEPTFALDQPKLLYHTWVAWVYSWILLWFSAEYGTPFSHLLTLMSAWGLATLFLLVFYAVTKSNLATFTKLFTKQPFAFDFKGQILAFSMLFTLIFGLASQNVSQVLSFAYPDLETASWGGDSLLDSSDLEQAWVYVLDPFSKKRVRLGHWGELKDSARLIDPMLKVTEKHALGFDRQKDKESFKEFLKKRKSKTLALDPARSRLRLRVSGGDFQLTRSSVCGGRSIYHLQPVGGAIEYSVFQNERVDTALSLSVFRLAPTSTIDIDDEYYATNPDLETETGLQARYLASARLKVDARLFRTGYLSAGVGVTKDGNDALPILHLGFGSNTLTTNSGRSYIFELGMGSGFEDLNSEELIGFYGGFKLRNRLDKDKDLILNLTKPMLLTGDAIFIGTGLRFQKVEFVLKTIVGGPREVMPAYGSLQFGF